MLRGFDPRAGGAVDVPDPYYGDDADSSAASTWWRQAAGAWSTHLVRPARGPAPERAV